MSFLSEVLFIWLIVWCIMLLLLVLFLFVCLLFVLLLFCVVVVLCVCFVCVVVFGWGVLFLLACLKRGLS